MGVKAMFYSIWFEKGPIFWKWKILNLNLCAQYRLFIFSNLYSYESKLQFFQLKNVMLLTYYISLTSSSSSYVLQVLDFNTYVISKPHILGTFTVIASAKQLYRYLWGAQCMMNLYIINELRSKMIGERDAVSAN
jgi:hypothetical protein